MATTILFELPIISPPTGKTIGTFICTSPTPQVYLLTFTSLPDNRLVTSFCQTFIIALDILEFKYPKGVVISTSSIAKFYSNGLDLKHATSVKDFWTGSLFKLFQRLLTCVSHLDSSNLPKKEYSSKFAQSYPMPTIAFINGHAFAGGFILAMYHDYRIFNPSRGFLCLNELDFGAALKPSMSSIFRQKVPYPAVYRSLVLEAKRFSGKDALECGLVDELGGMEETMRLIKERKLVGGDV
jgi:Delta3-Delta2-enoyl-CoA isomerase